MTVVEPHFISLSRGQERGVRWETWRIARMDHPDDGSFASQMSNASRRGAYRMRETAQREYVERYGANRDDRLVMDYQSEAYIYPPLLADRAADLHSLWLGEFVGPGQQVIIRTLAHGWPFVCMEWASVRPERSVPPGTTEPPEEHHWSITLHGQTNANTVDATWLLPLHPVWSGLAANTVFYGAIWALPLIGLPLLKQRRRRRKGHCPHCNYDLKSDLEHGCPECGWGREARQEQSSRPSRLNA